MTSHPINNIIEVLDNLLIKKGDLTPSEFSSIWTKAVRKYPKEDGGLYSKNEIRKYIEENHREVSLLLTHFLKNKPTRTVSGVAPLTIFTKPYICSGKCIFCPTAKNAPKSYLPEEPGVQRAIDLDYDPYLQIKRRIDAFEAIGHTTDKIELIISGGTWDDYDLNYRIWYILEVFRALNQRPSKPFDQQEKYSSIKYIKLLRDLEEENASTKYRCVGLTIETRPDKVNIENIGWYRRLGVTKVQLGVQFLHEEIIQLNKRGHTVEDSFNAIKLLRDAGFKVHIHWMANLYGSNLKLDLEDFKLIFDDYRVRPDELKIYPTSIVEGTVLYHFYQQGKYKPYSTEELITLLSTAKTFVQPYCRITRLFRDIPSDLIVDGNKMTNLREAVQARMKREGKVCNCIRCREVRTTQVDNWDLTVLKYKTSSGKEFFIQAVTDKGRLAGFLRLALYKENSLLIPVKAMIREVHVYGFAKKIGETKHLETQHRGIGARLLQEAEKIAMAEGAQKIGVIAGVGTRNYYRKHGFKIEHNFGYGIKDVF